MLKRIRIRNFKSLRDVDLKLRKVNVIVGPNGSGKSNLVDFFIFLKEMINPSSFPSDPFQTFGGYEEAVFLRDTSLPISFEIDGENFQYSADITGKSKNEFTINKETLIYKDFLLKRSFNYAEVKKVERAEREITKYHLDTNTSIFYLSKSPVPSIFDKLNELFSFMRNFANSFIPLRINPERAFAPVHYSYPEKLEVDGYGLARIVDYVLAYKGIPEQISMFLKENNLSIDRHTSPDSGNIVLVTRELIPDLNKTLPLYPRNVPAGIIKMITVFFAIYVLKPSLLIIDEIENSLHLKFIEELASAIYYSPPQFIITTHSPMVIDMFDPEDIILFYKEKGETKAEKIKDPEKLKDKLIDEGLALSEWIFYSANPTNP